MAIHYDDMMKKHPRLLREINQEICKKIHCQRWPPVYYLEETEEYEQQQREKKRQDDRVKKHKWCLKWLGFWLLAFKLLIQSISHSMFSTFRELYHIGTLHLDGSIKYALKSCWL